eukprot:scaffold1747_cov108-Isochrysis_galbana.AAC.12
MRRHQRRYRLAHKRTAGADEFHEHPRGMLRPTRLIAAFRRVCLRLVVRACGEGPPSGPAQIVEHVRGGGARLVGGGGGARDIPKELDGVWLAQKADRRAREEDQTRGHSQGGALHQRLAVPRQLRQQRRRRAEDGLCVCVVVAKQPERCERPLRDAHPPAAAARSGQRGVAGGSLGGGGRDGCCSGGHLGYHRPRRITHCQVERSYRQLHGAPLAQLCPQRREPGARPQRAKVVREGALRRAPQKPEEGLDVVLADERPFDAVQLGELLQRERAVAGDVQSRPQLLKRFLRHIHTRNNCVVHLGFAHLAVPVLVHDGDPRAQLFDLVHLKARMSGSAPAARLRPQPPARPRLTWQPPGSARDSRHLRRPGYGHHNHPRQARVCVRPAGIADRRQQTPRPAGRPAASPSVRHGLDGRRRRQHNVELAWLGQ